MAEQKPRYKVHGETVHDGMVLIKSLRPSVCEKVKSFSLDGDIVVASYAKTGTTWLQEITWLVCHGADVEKAAKKRLVMRVPFLEVSLPPFNKPAMDIIRHMSHPRILKTHLPGRYFTTQILQQDVKVVLAIRNPKDTLVSFYHFYRSVKDFGLFPGTWDEFFELFREKHIVHGDFFEFYSDWLVHIHSSDKVLIVKFEDMKKNIIQEIQRIAQFLDKDLTEEQINRIGEHVQFANMKDNKMVNYTKFPEKLFFKKEISPFMRKGIIGDWKNYFSEEQSQFVDARYEKWLGNGGIALEFE